MGEKKEWFWCWVTPSAARLAPHLALEPHPILHLLGDSCLYSSNLLSFLFLQLPAWRVADSQRHSIYLAFYFSLLTDSKTREEAWETFKSNIPSFFLSAGAAVLQRKTKSKQRDIAWQKTRTKKIISCIFTSKAVLKTLWMIFGSSHLVSSSPQISQSTGITSQQLVGIRKYFNSQSLEQLEFQQPRVTFIVKL